MAHQLVDVTAIFRILDKADAKTDMPVFSFDHLRFGECSQERAAEPVRSFRTRFFEVTDEKLVTAEPGDHVAGAGNRFQFFGNQLQKGIACRVPKGIVHQFEIIEIEQVERSRLVLCVCGLQDLRKSLLQIGPVGETGQGVVAGQVLGPLLGFVQLGNIDFTDEIGGLSGHGIVAGTNGEFVPSGSGNGLHLRDELQRAFAFNLIEDVPDFPRIDELVMKRCFQGDAGRA